ncbi:MAG: hypothetical protein QF713_00335 [Dehalococcoidales bacterium]|nr:hypothetical protein [Dehalococcoidales bacterium]MDP7524773.1 hypothetical protein [Dehalococcoidales bacterium]
MPYLAELEKAGIPTILIDLAEETAKVKHDALIYGVPEMRLVEASRTLAGPIDVDNIIGDVIDGLVSPLTDKEQESGRWEPEEPRILFEGTLDKAQEFYQQTEKIPGILDAPFSMYTDGLPIIIPTEEKVREMLAGTSHKPDELIALQRDVEVTGMGALGGGFTKKKGDLVKFMPMGRTATVEQVAVNAVMAGCKPEYFPVVLAIAESGGGTGDGRGGGGSFVVSGPIYKELGMNVSYGRFSIGNPPNKAIGRVGSLLWRNLGGYKETVSTIMTYGSPSTNGGFIYAEYAEGLPDGWKGLNEENGFRKDESIIMPTGSGAGGGQFWMPGVYRALQKSGHGAIARWLDVKGIPGPHNFLDYLCDGMWATREGGVTLVMVPSIAQDLRDVGFESKDQIYEYIYKLSFEPVKKYRMRGGPDFFTNGWMGIEKTSGKHWKELDDDYMVPVCPEPSSNCIIIVDGEETVLDRFQGGHGNAYSIDDWR